MELNARSLRNLEGVHPDLVRVVERAASKTHIDFVVTEGVRTEERQRALYEKHATKTMLSRHIPSSNLCAMGCAVDLAAIIDGEARWDGGLYFELAYVMQSSAHELGVDITWGGCWQSLADAADLEAAQAAYVARKRAKGERPLIDGPHFELSKRRYA